MQYITWIIQTLVILIISIIGFLLKKSIKDWTDKLEKIDNDIKQFREEMLKEYVRKDDFKNNEISHKEIWQEINSVRERVARIEK